MFRSRFNFDLQADSVALGNAVVRTVWKAQRHAEKRCADEFYV